MLIRWFGECSFLIQDTLGHRIILNPYNSLLTNYFISLNPNLILLSNDKNMDIINLIKNSNIPAIYNINNNINLEYTTIHCFNSYSDKIKGIKRGNNIIFCFTLDKLKICYLGYLGHILSNNLINSISDTDILFIPIGGHISINGYEASILIKKISPKYIIPMYYRTFDKFNYLDNCRLFLTSTGYNINVSNSVIDTNSINNITPQIILLNETLY